MKVLQVHVFYDRYLQEFCARHSRLTLLDFDGQMEVLLGDAFSSGHMLTPYLRNGGHDARLIVANFAPAQLQWAREVGFCGFTEQDWRYSIVRRQIEVFRPDVLYLSHPVDGYDSRLFRSLSVRPRLVFGWRAAAIPADTDWSEFDLLLSHLSVCRTAAIRHGARKAMHFHPGFSTFVLAETKAQPVEWDVVFSGQWSPEHGRRNELIRHACAAATGGDRAFSFGLFLATAGSEIPKVVKDLNRGPKWGLDMYRCLKSGRIALNAEIGLACGEAGNMRMFEAVGMGALLLTEGHKNVCDYFKPGTEVETFRSEPELVEKIRYYMEHPDERERIAARGQERCLREYSMERRAEVFRHIVEETLREGEAHKRLSKACTPPASSPPLFSGSLSEVLNSVSKILPQHPRRISGSLEVDGRLLRYVDLHSLFHQARQIFGEHLYGFRTQENRPVIYDCGAHIGLASLYFATNWPNAEIHSFEADPEIAAVLSANVQSFDLDNVSIYNKAVWKHADGVEFQQRGDDSGAVGCAAGCKIESIRLRDLLKHQRIDLLKLDIEGAEFDVIQDCDGFLDQVQCIIAEVHQYGRSDHRLSRVLTILEENRFKTCLADLHHATWVSVGHDAPPFPACKTEHFVVTVYAWRSSEPSRRSASINDVELSLRELARTGVGYLNACRNQEALKCFDEIAQRSGNAPGVQFGRAVALARLGDVNKAIEALRLIPTIALSSKAKLLRDQLELLANASCQ